MIFTNIVAGDNISQLPTIISTQFEAVRTFERGSQEPSVRPEGMLWQTTDPVILNNAGLTGASEGFVRWNSENSSWEAFADSRSPQINAGGTVAFAADQSMGGNKISNLGASSAPGDAVRRDEALLTDGSNPLVAALNMGGFGIRNVQAGVDNLDAVNVGQLNDFAQGLLNSSRSIVTFGQPPSGTGFRKGLWLALVYKNATGSFQINNDVATPVMNATVGTTFMFFNVGDETTITYPVGAQNVSYVIGLHLRDPLS